MKSITRQPAFVKTVNDLPSHLTLSEGAEDKIVSASFMALTKPEFRFYVKPNCGLAESDFVALNKKITISDNHVSARFLKNADTGAILLEITGIEAENMDEIITITIDGFGTIVFCGNDFARLLARNTETAALGAALYNYGTAAKACFAKGEDHHE